MAEIWKPIKGYEPYEVSNRGNIRGEEPIEPSISASGFAEVQLDNATLSVHEVVADHFLAPPIGSTKVKHIDGDKTHNHCANLQWVESGKRNKLNEEDIERIRELWAGGLKQSAIAAMYDITQQNVNLIVNGYTWKGKMKS